MTKNPCLGCELRKADKNNATCRECDKRVEYVALIEKGGCIMGATNIGSQEPERCIMGATIRPRKPYKKRGGSQAPDIKDQKKADDSQIKPKDFSDADDSYLRKIADDAAEKVVAEMMAQKAEAEELPGKIEYTDWNTGIIVDLEKYPRIKKQIDFLAEKYFVTPEYVIIGMVVEALAGRKEKCAQSRS